MEPHLHCKTVRMGESTCAETGGMTKLGNRCKAYLELCVATLPAHDVLVRDGEGVLRD